MALRARLCQRLAAASTQELTVLQCMFCPFADEDMTGMVINAIMACTEPKMCSANLLKKYVVEWYSEKFKVADRPHLFRKAIDRAVANQEIK